MSAVIDRVVREPLVGNAAQYARRVRRLAWAYVGLFIGSAAGIGLLIWQAQYYVTLAQRSNVETLVLAFFLLFFAYLIILSWSGALGAVRLLGFAITARVHRNRIEVEQWKMRALGPPRKPPASAALSMVLEMEGAPCQPFAVPVKDAAGSMGEIVVHGAEIRHHQTTRDGSNSLLAYFAEQVNDLLTARDEPGELDVVEWRDINDESMGQYLGMVSFAQNLRRHLQVDELWPTCTLRESDRAELERRLSAICGPLRDEEFLPHWEYEGEHKLPLVPEPLGIVSLSRTEKRVDPLASMGCAVLVVLASVIVFALIFAFPPWVPGK
jgi:hypothetical protein